MQQGFKPLQRTKWETSLVGPADNAIMAQANMQIKPTDSIAPTKSWPSKARWVLLAVGGLLLTVAIPAEAAPGTNTAAGGKVAYSRNLDAIKKMVETLRGKKFLHDVPAFKVSEQEMRAIAERDLIKEYPGGELADYQAMLVWLDMVPPGTDLQAVETGLFVGEAAGFYDSDTKEMCIPSFSATPTNAWQNPARKTVKEEADKYSPIGDDFIFAHEFTHALEDQYWPFDDPLESSRRESTDRDAARSFLAEGAATRVMVEAIPALWAQDSPESYPLAWNVLHSGPVESLLDLTLGILWKTSAAEVPGLPETLARSQVMPYCYGYNFCSEVMRDWGLDGLDWINDHPPASTAQIMHPEKAWEWRDLPAAIRLPETSPDGWKLNASDSLGEAGVAVLLGCSFRSLGGGTWLADGWDGDRVALFEAPDGRHLLVWASVWDSDTAARRFAGAWLNQRQALHHALADPSRGPCLHWTQPDGHIGTIVSKGRTVLIFEADRPDIALRPEAWDIGITLPPEKSARASANPALYRFNPLFSWQQDADYSVNRSFWGLLSKHDCNGVGAADRVLLGLVGESHRTASFNKWELGWSLIAKHESDARRGYHKTTVLPWGVLYGQFHARLPQDTNYIVARVSALWGVAGSWKQDGTERSTFHLLPGGILFSHVQDSQHDSTTVLWTGLSRTKVTPGAKAKTKFRLLGVRLPFG
jgi:hypothetical protein